MVQSHHFGVGMACGSLCCFIVRGWLSPRPLRISSSQLLHHTSNTTPIDNTPSYHTRWLSGAYADRSNDKAGKEEVSPWLDQNNGYYTRSVVKWRSWRWARLQDWEQLKDT